MLKRAATVKKCILSCQCRKACIGLKDDFYPDTTTSLWTVFFSIATFLEQELPAEPVLPLLLLLLLLQTLHNSKPQLLVLVSCVYPTDHGKKGEEEGVYNRKIINSDTPWLSARQSLAAQERPQCARCDCLLWRAKLLRKTPAGAFSSSSTGNSV